MKVARGRIRRVALVGRSHRSAVGRRLAELEIWLDKRGIEVVLVRGRESIPSLGWVPDADAAARARKTDLLIALGGDGTILAGARMVAGSRVPLLPVNLGGLGFLASYEGRDLTSAVEAALSGNLGTDRRSMLEAFVDPAGRTKPLRPRSLGMALNDAVVKPATPFRALRMSISVDGQALGHIVADGLVVATPSGSTAYSLSAGGPILAPGLEALVVTPICAHTLGSRALVLPPGRQVEVAILPRDGASGVLSLDGLDGVGVGPGDRVRVRLVPDAVRFLRPRGAALPLGLHTQLGWQGAPRRLV